MKAFYAVGPRCKKAVAFYREFLFLGVFTDVESNAVADIFVREKCIVLEDAADISLIGRDG